MKDTPIDFNPQHWSDQETGRRMTRLFPVGTEAVHAYFTSTSYDNRGDLILSVRIQGLWQLCRVDLKAGKAWCITGLEAMRPQGYCVSPAADCAIVADGDQLVRIDLESGESTPVLKVPEGVRTGIPTVDAGGSRVAFVVSEKAPGFTASERLYSTMAEDF